MIVSIGCIISYFLIIDYFGPFESQSRWLTVKNALSRLLRDFSPI